MKKKWYRNAAAVMAAVALCTQGISVSAENTVSGTDEVTVEYLTIQPGATTASVNLNWYAPEGTGQALVKFGDIQVQADLSELHMPTKLDESKYTDTGKVVCKAEISGLTPGTSYEYQISYDGGSSWSQAYSYTTADADEFSFGFTSDPQIKESGETDARGWNSSDGTNQTGWAAMMKKLSQEGVNLIVSAGDQVEDQNWGKSSEYAAFFAPEEMSSIPYAPAVGNHDRQYMFEDHFNLPNEMPVQGADENGVLEQVKTTFPGQNSGTSQSHGNYIQASSDEISGRSDSNGVKPDENGIYDFAERREMETRANYYYLYNNVLFVTLNTGAYPGGNDEENQGNPDVPSAGKDNSEAEAIVDNFRTTLDAATSQYAGQYQWLVVAHHKSTQTVAKHSADSDIENYVDAGFEKVMDEFDVDFVLGGHDHVYSRSYVLKDGKRNAERLDNYYDPDGTIYLTGNCCSDMQYYTPFEKLDKSNNQDYPVLANGKTGSEAYMEGALPAGNQEWNQEYSPCYAVFHVSGNTISVDAYNLSGDGENPDSQKIDSFRVTKNIDGGAKSEGTENQKASLEIIQDARYESGMSDPDGAVMEIVAYNPATGWAYAVNGRTGNLTAIAYKDMEKKDSIDLLDGNDIDIKSIIRENCSDFTYGDMTSVAVSSDGSKLAAAVQAEDYRDNGRAVLFFCNEDGTLTFDKAFETGVQPDMITFTPDDTKILTANEGEPREGYGQGKSDPKGTVSVISPAEGKVRNIGFETYDNEEDRNRLTDEGIIIKKGSRPSEDLEPEYIAADNGRAYVTLQEANAIAVIDLQKLEVEGIYSAGYEDYSVTPVDINKKDEAYDPKTYESLKGIRMPDGIALYSCGGADYIVTANEGDSREWADYLNEDERNFKDGDTSPTGKITSENSGLSGKVVFFDSTDYDGLDDGTDYLFGGRSFTIYRADENGLTEVYSSGNDFEEKTARYVPENFNCSNDDKTTDDRSGKKGPEPESVAVGRVGEKTYAFIGLERVGGVMAYDISEPSEAGFVNYINSRDFSADIAGDDSPEGLSFIPADGDREDAYLLAACEVSGTVAAYRLTENDGAVSDEEKDPAEDIGPDEGNNPENNAGQEENKKPDASDRTETDNNVKEQYSQKAPKTGDNSPLSVYIMFAVLAGTVCIAAAEKRRNK